MGAALFLQIDDAAAAAIYRKTIEQAGGLRSKDVARLTKDDIASYDGIYIAGGHGCMEDMPASPPMTRFLLAVLALNKPLASVCHGPTAFLSPRDMAGQSPFAVPSHLFLSRRGVLHESQWTAAARARDRAEATRPGILQGPLPRASHVVVDRNLVTGQNPFSSEAMAKQFLDLLERSHDNLYDRRAS